MTALQTPQEFVAAVRGGRLVDPDRLRAFVAVLRGQPPLTARRIADRAVAAGLLTRFQADEVVAGRADDLVLADYRLLSQLGEGGAGGVFLAEHGPTGERRAVKVLHSHHADGTTARDRLSREAAVAAGLCHPNVVRVFEYDPGCTDRPPFLAMEYVDGVSLQAAVALVGTFTAEAAAECGRQVALALQHAWDAGLVHRDIKPANLLLAREGVAKVLDFGLVRLLGGGGQTIVNGRKLVGTADYVAPEQITNGSAVDCRADIYALGGTLYFLLAGHPPFRDVSWTDRLRGAHTDPPPIHHLRPDVPEQLSAVLAAMLARHPDQRPATPADAARRLARWADAAFADDLFTRLDRGDTDTPPEGLPVTPGPLQAIDRPTDDDPPDEKGSTVEIEYTPPQDTVRVEQPLIVRPSPPPDSRFWWLPAVAVFGIVVVTVVLILALTVVR